MNISQWKIGDRTFFSLEVDDRLLLLNTLVMELHGQLPSSYLIGINWIPIAEFGVEADSIPVQCSKDEAKSHAYLSSADRQRSDSFKKRRPTLLRALTRQ